MAQKCVHQSCGKIFSDPEEKCLYHPGPPIFHEGQKSWKCCKPRVLTFDEFLKIPPCTIGKHSAIEIPPAIEKKTIVPEKTPIITPTQASNNVSQPVFSTNPCDYSAYPPKSPTPEFEDDDPNIIIPIGKTCRRKGCGEKYTGESRANESCYFHPGPPIFHEGSKGYLCCKRRVLEFDQFIKIKGCTKKIQHLFIGSEGKKEIICTGEEVLESVRYDFYQTARMVIASFFLKKIDIAQSHVKLSAAELDLDLVTTDAVPKHYKKTIPLYSAIDPVASNFKITSTKLELNLLKMLGSSWPALRSDEKPSREIIQAGNAEKF